MGLVLLIEEDADSGALIERLLVRQGHEVANFSREAEALRWLAGGAPDLAVVSAGKYGERARSLLSALKAAGVDGRRIVLISSAGALAALRRDFGKEVRQILTGLSDLEALQSLADSDPAAVQRHGWERGSGKGGDEGP